MTLLTNWPTVWLMTGMGVGIVFCILIILVLILKFMGNINARTMGKTKAQAVADDAPAAVARQRLQRPTWLQWPPQYICTRMICMTTRAEYSPGIPQRLPGTAS